jgi:hypothetical protein
MSMILAPATMKPISLFPRHTPLKTDIVMTVQRVRSEDLSWRELDCPERFNRDKTISELSQTTEIAGM